MPIEPGDKKAHVNFWYFVAAVGPILLLRQRWQLSRQVETIAMLDDTARRLLEKETLTADELPVPNPPQQATPAAPAATPA